MSFSAQNALSPLVVSGESGEEMVMSLGGSQWDIRGDTTSPLTHEKGIVEQATNVIV